MHTSVLSLSVPADLACSQLVRQSVKSALEMTSLPACWVYRLMLVLDELFMNAVKYGSRPKDMVQVDILRRPTGVLIRVSDKGRSNVSPQQLSRVVRKNTAREGIMHTSGRGLALIARAWSDRFAIRRSAMGGIMVEVEKKFSTASRDILPVTTMHRRSSKQREVLEVHLHEGVLAPESAQEFARLVDVLADPSSDILNFDCRELGHLSHSALTRLLELYLTVISRGATVRWSHISSSLELALRPLKILDKSSK